jgi:hypothetical protein
MVAPTLVFFIFINILHDNWYLIINIVLGLELHLVSKKL